MADNHWLVWDARTGRVQPERERDGYYTESDAKKLAKNLNEFVHRNSGFPFAAQVIGPFYAHPESMRSKLQGRPFGSKPAKAKHARKKRSY